MALVLDGATGVSNIQPGVIDAADFAAGVLPAFAVKRRNSVLRSSIQATSGTYTDDLTSLLTARTCAVILQVQYEHNGTNNHGYWQASFYQSGKGGSNDNIFYFDRAHFNWYYNRFWVEQIIPWDITGSNNLTVAVTSGLFTGDNKYAYGIAGVIEK